MKLRNAMFSIIHTYCVYYIHQRKEERKKERDGKRNRKYYGTEPLKAIVIATNAIFFMCY